MIVSLYKGLSEFTAPASSKTEGGEDKFAQTSAPNSLFERVNAEQSATEIKPADVSPLGLSVSHAQAYLSDGYRLHEFKIDNLESDTGISPASRLADLNSDASSLNTSAILPQIQLDFSSDQPTPKSAATTSA